MATTNDLPPITRLITAHSAEGKSVFSTTLSENPGKHGVDNDSFFFTLGYCSEQFPVDMNQDKDVQVYERYIGDAPGLVIPTGVVMRWVDMTPGMVTPMHRTVSLDYGIVTDGEVELVLDSGEKKTMKCGDVAVQRGTMHAWRNTSSTRWARMMFVLTPSQPLEVGGQELEEQLGTVQGVRSSG